jgi:hypothetical protein
MYSVNCKASTQQDYAICIVVLLAIVLLNTLFFTRLQAQHEVATVAIISTSIYHRIIIIIIIGLDDD